jgi:hypothetical protein
MVTYLEVGPGGQRREQRYHQHDIHALIAPMVQDDGGLPLDYFGARFQRGLDGSYHGIYFQSGVSGRRERPFLANNAAGQGQPLDLSQGQREALNLSRQPQQRDQ